MNELPFCKCGCGKKVTKKRNTYILGHNIKDIIFSEETRQKMRERLKGKSYEELHGSEKAKEIKKKLWKNREKKDPPNKGKTFDEYFGKVKADIIREKISLKNTNNPKLKDRKGKKNPYYKGAKDSLYEHWSPKLEFDINRKNVEEKIEVRCTYCNKWFVPTQVELDNRIGALRRNGIGAYFYCSDECKDLCPDHYQVLWPKNYKPYDNINKQSEVHPDLRKLVFERDKWICQKCHSENFLQCHHTDPVSQEPLFANDIDSCITLCKECHKDVHMKIEGCKYNELRRCK